MNMIMPVVNTTNDAIQCMTDESLFNFQWCFQSLSRYSGGGGGGNLPWMCIEGPCPMGGGG